MDDTDDQKLEELAAKAELRILIEGLQKVLHRQTPTDTKVIGMLISPDEKNMNRFNDALSASTKQGWRVIPGTYVFNAQSNGGTWYSCLMERYD